MLDCTYRVQVPHRSGQLALAAGAIAARRHAGIELRRAVVGQLGLGAAGFGIASLMSRAAAAG